MPHRIAGRIFARIPEFVFLKKKKDLLARARRGLVKNAVACQGVLKDNPNRAAHEERDSHTKYSYPYFVCTGWLGGYYHCTDAYEDRSEQQ